MSRLIKFRAWDGEKMRYDGFTDSKMMGCACIFNTLKVKSDELMQFTGLKDKNGVEIYESDILKDGVGNIGQVYYWTALAKFAIDYPDDFVDTFDMYDMDHEIIGNIHQHPELIA